MTCSICGLNCHEIENIRRLNKEIAEICMNRNIETWEWNNGVNGGEKE